ncbi:hypothetical protein O7635_08685 [Asanoa sp. WMMD1127]|uniref:hypothetical protein n=1 Tax=Asanoa sp. WMMD1127 TaxID=3016107 RepID=UPI00241655D0|nr:hypothetical protein [Asanoa sp. WMMD1127]MDG4821927.1 hypothetical protein [Asanoa sp. WMMD1127]
MHAEPIRLYVTMGYKLRYLLDVSVDHPVYGEKHVLETIKSLIASASQCGLHVTARAASELFRGVLADWARHEGRASAQARKLTTEETALVREASYQLQTVMLAEAQNVFAHVTRDKRFSVDRLLYNVASLMAPGIFDSMPKVAKYDFGEAGRCIAFELPTAAAFHLMRGTEDVLKSFYRTLIEDQVSPLLWGPMVAHLRDKLDPPPLILLNNLDGLRVGFRNPTQHPEKIYDIEEAQDLFGLSVDSVNRMVKYLKRRGRDLT